LHECDHNTLPTTFFTMPNKNYTNVITIPCQQQAIMMIITVDMDTSISMDTSMDTSINMGTNTVRTFKHFKCMIF
jgi:hypothetical protein